MLLAPLLCVGLLPAPAGAGAREDPAEVLREADRQFFRATRERGLEGWLAWFAGDAVAFPPAGALAVGAAELRRHYEGLDGFPPPGFVWEPEQAGLAASSDLGWTAGRWGIEQPGKETAWRGRYLSIWRRDPDGAWKVVADCGGEPDFATRVTGLAGAPASAGRECERTFRSQAGDLTATIGTWWARDADGGELDGKFLAVWRRTQDGAQELAAETGFAHPR